MKVNKSITVGAGIASLAIIASGATGAVASSLVGSAGIRDNSVRSVDLHDGSAVRPRDLAPGLLARVNQHGINGTNGTNGRDGLEGAVYRVEWYKNGGGGDATVACADSESESQKYTAIAGGVQAGHTGSNDFAVTASYPGRMDWSTGTPKEGRLDGWIVLGNGKYTENLKVWALCVPTNQIPVEQINLDN